MKTLLKAGDIIQAGFDKDSIIICLSIGKEYFTGYVLNSGVRWSDVKVLQRGKIFNRFDVELWSSFKKLNK